MHTAVCTFRDRDTAERAREHLLRAGFARDDLHIEHRGRYAADGQGRHAGEDTRGWSGTDHEIAVDRRVVDRVAGFFVHLFGSDHPLGHDRMYGDAVQGGRYVLVVDSRDAAEAQRAHTLLHEVEAEDVNVVHRSEHRTLREIVGDDHDPGLGGSYLDRASAFDDHATRQAAATGAVTGEPAQRSQPGSPARNPEWSDRSEAARERALAAGQSGEQRPLDLRDPDLDHVGLRYADQDKPGK